MRAYVLFLFCLGLAGTVHGECDRPTGGANMMLSSSITFPVQDGTTVTFTCETGYKQRGTSGTIACSKGTWSNLNMICEIINCGNAGEVQNGYVDYSEGTEFGATVHTVCNSGYVAVGGGSLYCGVQGWQGRLAECEVVMCDAPASVTNGYFEPVKEEYEHAEVVTYTCNRDYVLNGSKRISCSEERVFKPSPPTCVLVNCPNPDVTNGQVASGSRPPYKHMSSVTLRCKIGHTMIGSDTLTCGINSLWEPALPTCKPSECKAPEITNGQVVDGAHPSYKYSETVTLKCDTGYTLSGQSTLTCGTNDQWSPAIPTCTKIQCQAPEVKDGKLVGVSHSPYDYLESVTIECNTGFTMNGQNIVKCDLNSQWSPKLPECTKIQCQAPEVKDGKLVGVSHSPYDYLESVTIECNTGFTMNGQNIVKCDLNSQWSPKLPECTTIECKTPEVEHGQLVLGSRPSYKYLDTVMFECKTGYTMNGPSTLTCELNRQWSPELPECTRSNGNVWKTVLGVVGGLGAAAVVAGVVYKIWTNKKTGAGKICKEAAQEAATEAETVALS